MSNQVWSDGSVSVIVLPSGVEGRKLLQVAREWTAAWLLAPAIWVRAEDVPMLEQGPPEIPGVVLGRSPDGDRDEVSVELFWKLGEFERDRVRLIAVRMIQDDADQAITSAAISQLDTYLERALPTPSVGAPIDGKHTEFLRLNLIVDAAEENGLDPRAVFQPAWDANIVASPEDRSSPGSPDSPPLNPRHIHDSYSHGEFEREETPTHANSGRSNELGLLHRAERYYGWVLAHLATTAGIWVGMHKSTYDLMPTRPAVAHQMCLIQRVCVRGVLTDGLAIDLAIEAMESVLDDSEVSNIGIQNAMAITHGVEAFNDSLAHERVKAMVDTTLKGFRSEGFGYNTYQAGAPYQKHKQNLVEAFTAYFSLGAQAFINLPRLLWHLVTHRVANVMSVEDGDTIVEARTAWNAGLPTVDDGLFVLQNSMPPSTAGLRPSPQVWRDLRDMVLISMDADPSVSVAESLFTNDSTGKRMVFGSRADVLPDPSEEWQGLTLDTVDGAYIPTLGWMDAIEAAQSLEILQDLYDSRVPQVLVLRETAQEAELQARTGIRELTHVERLLNEAEGELIDSERWLQEMRTDHPHSVSRRKSTTPSPEVSNG